MPLNSFMLRLSRHHSFHISVSYFVKIVVVRISVSYFVKIIVRISVLHFVGYRRLLLLSQFCSKTLYVLQYSVSIFCFVPVNQCWFWIENSWFIVMSENLKRPDLSVPVNWCTQSLVKCDLSCLILTHCLIRRKVQCQLNIVVIYLVVIILYNCCTLIDLVQMLAFVWAISWLRKSIWLWHRIWAQVYEPFHLMWSWRYHITPISQ